MAKKKTVADIVVTAEFTKTIFDGQENQYRKGDRVVLTAEQAEKYKKYIKAV